MRIRGSARPDWFKNTVSGKAKLGVKAFANAMLTIPKVLAENSGFDVQESIIKPQEEQEESGVPHGLDVVTVGTMSPVAEGVWDNAGVKRQSIHLSTVLAIQLLLHDEIMKAGKKMGKQAANPDDEGN